MAMREIAPMALPPPLPGGIGLIQVAMGSAKSPEGKRFPVWMKVRLAIIGILFGLFVLMQLAYLLVGSR
jgi:hypothetical protein